MNEFTSASASGALRQYPRFDFQFFRELRCHCNVFAARQALDRQRFETGVHFRLLGHPQQRAEILGYIAVFAGCELAADERLQEFWQRDDDGCHGRRRRRLGSQSAYYWNCYPLSTDKTNPVERSGAVDIFYAVSKWGNSLAAHFPAAVVEPLDLKEGDEIEISIAGKRDFKFNREENERPIAGLPSSAASVLERLLRRPR